jgi:hypothetical protein
MRQVWLRKHIVAHSLAKGSAVACHVTSALRRKAEIG